MAAALDFCPQYQEYFRKSPGVEHYRLLESLVKNRHGGIVVDVGTLYGSSALALSSNPRVEVWTYDIVNHIPESARIRHIPNISFRIMNGIQAVADFAHKTDLIVLDIDPHDGIQEPQFFEALRMHGYRGIVVCDDIHLNPRMEAWWQSIILPKADLTSLGHSTGTGIISFSSEKDVELAQQTIEASCRPPLRRPSGHL